MLSKQNDKTWSSTNKTDLIEFYQFVDSIVSIEFLSRSKQCILGHGKIQCKLINPLKLLNTWWRLSIIELQWLPILFIIRFEWSTVPSITHKNIHYRLVGLYGLYDKTFLPTRNWLFSSCTINDDLFNWIDIILCVCPWIKRMRTNVNSWVTIPELQKQQHSPNSR